MNITELLCVLCPPLLCGLLTDLAAFCLPDASLLLQTMAGSLASLPFLLFFVRQERLPWRSEVSPSVGQMPCAVRSSFSFPPPSRSLLLFLSGCLLSIAGNCLVGLLRDLFFPSLTSAAVSALYREPLWLQLFSSGLLLPFTEELCFRALGFSVLRRHGSFLRSALLSSLLFACWHGELLQGLYAFFAGLCFCLVLEKEQTLTAPFLVHSSANLTSILLTALSAGPGFHP